MAELQDISLSVPGRWLAGSLAGAPPGMHWSSIGIISGSLHLRWARSRDDRDPAPGCSCDTSVDVCGCMATPAAAVRFATAVPQNNHDAASRPPVPDSNHENLRRSRGGRESSAIPCAWVREIAARPVRHRPVYVTFSGDCRSEDLLGIVKYVTLQTMGEGSRPIPYEERMSSPVITAPPGRAAPRAAAMAAPRPSAREAA